MSNHSIVIPVQDLAAATAFYTTAFGVEPHTDTPYYVGFNHGGQEIGLNPNGHVGGMAGSVVFWNVDAVAGKVAEAEAAGASIVQAATEVGGGTTTGIVTDTDGNQLGFITRS
ncbi:VOC family protein [Nocardioides sp. B-3]|uniref:VOC family protein n=1 Tax=Nocardioides sp. B-3 TaxID=2895565 RepID=UPI0021521A9E|nr:VOC family protein [Nocardioides sp. B-3]UUZ58777.1 VOC family protein [Nocardioides sp. B-3]